LAEQLLKSPTESAGTNAELPADARRWMLYSRDSARAVFDRFNRLPLDVKQTEMQALRIQDLLILTDPGETFITFANQIQQSLPEWKLWVVGYANDYVGYIPSADRYDLTKEQFSYPAYFTPMMNGEFRFREDVGDVLVQQLVGLAHDVTSR
jgi:hypothetical protein